MDYQKSLTRSSASQILKLFVLTGIALAFTILFCGVTQAHAATVELDDFVIELPSYKVTQTSISQYKGSAKEITIPSKVSVTTDGVTTEYTIEAIASSAFTDTKSPKAKGIKKITLPDTIKTIGTNAFQECTGLQEINIPASVTEISANAFKDCTALAQVTFALEGTENLAIRGSAFENTGLTSITLPSRVSNINNDGNVFCGANNLTAISVEDGCSAYFSEDGVLYAVIDDSTAGLLAWPEAKATTVTIPSTAKEKAVTTLSRMSFSGNTSITKVTIPSSITTIEYAAMQNCSAMESITLEHENKETLTIGGNAFINMKEGSVIYVKSEEIKALLAPPDNYTKYYTEGTTTVEISGSGSEPTEVVKGSISVEATSLKDNKAVYTIYASDTSNVANVKINITADTSKLENPVIQGGDNFTVLSDPKWTAETGTLSAIICYGLNGNTPKLTTEEKVKVADITFDVTSGATGKLSISLDKATLNGWVDGAETEDAADATILESKADLSIFSYDVNGDGVVDQLDITRVQRYYKMTSSDSQWNDTVAKCDVDNSGTIDIEDLIAIYRNIA